MFSYFLKLSALVLAIGLPAFVNAQTKSFYAAHHDYNVVTVAEGFAQPWSMAWLPDGDMLVLKSQADCESLGMGNYYRRQLPVSQRCFIPDKAGCLKFCLTPILKTIVGFISALLVLRAKPR